MNINTKKEIELLQKNNPKRDREILKKQRKFQKKYIILNQGSRDPIILLRVIRFILRTPEGGDIVTQANKIMARIIKKDL